MRYLVLIVLAFTLLSAGCYLPDNNQPTPQTSASPDPQVTPTPDVSPIAVPVVTPTPEATPTPAPSPITTPTPTPITDFTVNSNFTQYRSYDGTNNNLSTTWGKSDSEFTRSVPAAYADLFGAPAGADRPNARVISNLVVEQPKSIKNTLQASDMLWQWGQFIDHDMAFTGTMKPAEAFPIAVPMGDMFLDPMSTGTAKIALSRSSYRMVNGVRQQINSNSAYLDASMIYGGTSDIASALRTHIGGTLLTSMGNLLPFNTMGLPNQPAPNMTNFFIAGDVRSNEQLGLTALHTLFLREHNRLAALLAMQDSTLSDEDLFQRARAIVAAEIQAITYKEFLPTLLGAPLPSMYTGYRADVNAGIDNLFATAAFRFGHTMVSASLWRFTAQLMPTMEGNINLMDSFFHPEKIVNEGGIEPLLRGLTQQLSESLDNMIVSDLRNALFGPPGSGGMDLAALNIQRGRDHGLPTYNQARIALGLNPAMSFAAISSDMAVQQKLASAYMSVDSIDLWVGGLAEDHEMGSLVGPLFGKIIRDQFTRLRDGDRFWYQRYLPQEWVSFVDQQTLSAIIQQNTNIGMEISSDVFHVPMGQ